MRDVVLMLAVALTFAWVVTAHLSILGGLVRRKQYGRAALSLLLPVLAPYFAWREGLRRRAWLWLGGAILYAAAFATAWRSEASGVAPAATPPVSAP